MAQHSTRKAGTAGKRATLAARQARANKRTPDASLTRSGHIRTIKGK